MSQDERRDPICCAHCGRMIDAAAGHAKVSPDTYVCHPRIPDGPDCYKLLTVYGEELGDRMNQAATDALMALREDFLEAQATMTPEGRGAASLSGELADGIAEMRRQHQATLARFNEADRQLTETKKHYIHRTESLTWVRDRLKRRLDAVIDEVFTISEAYPLAEDRDEAGQQHVYNLGRQEGLSLARYAVLRGLGIFEPTHVTYVPKPEHVYIPEAVDTSDNVWDGRTRYGVHLTLQSALAALEARYGGQDDPVVATQCETAHIAETDWMVHRRSEEPSEEGMLWIFQERVR